jgi:hypothetical protein
VNLLGEGPKSDWSEAIYLDVVPPALAKPIVVKSDPTSLLVTIVPLSQQLVLGSSIVAYRILLAVQGGDVQTVDVPDPSVLNHVVADLAPASEYAIRIVARNKAGPSDPSEPVAVCLAELLSIPSAPILETTSSTTARVRVQPIDDTEFGVKPASYKIFYAKNADLTDAKEAACAYSSPGANNSGRKTLSRKPKATTEEETFCDVEGLDEGTEYFFALKAVDAHGTESGQSPVVSVTLPAAPIKSSQSQLAGSNRSSSTNLHRTSLRDVQATPLKTKSRSGTDLTGSKDVVAADVEKSRPKLIDSPSPLISSVSHASLAETRRPVASGDGKHRFTPNDRKKPPRVGFEAKKATEGKE